MNTAYPAIKRNDLIYPELSYRIIGLIYDVHDEVGSGFKEQVYQRALALAFKNSGLQFEEQLYAPLVYKGEKVGNNYFDFLVEEKVVIEIKKGSRFVKADIEQLFQFKRVVNLIS